MATNNYQKSDLKKTKAKTKMNYANNQNRNRITEMEIMWMVIRGEGGEWGKGTGNKKHNQQVLNRQGEVKNSNGNGEAKELICMTHGHELREGRRNGMLVGGEVRVGGR